VRLPKEFPNLDRKEVRFIAGGAALALVLGLGAGFMGRAPLDRALRSRPMDPVPGTSQIVATAPPLTPASSIPAAPARAAARADAPTIATGDDPPNDVQSASADVSQVDAPLAAPAEAEARPPQARPTSQRSSRWEFSRYGEASPPYPPPWANRGPPPWAPPPPPPPDYDPD
jgi:hypothetical protein